jgi:hypothetical protein
VPPSAIAAVVIADNLLLSLKTTLSSSLLHSLNMQVDVGCTPCLPTADMEVLEQAVVGAVEILCAVCMYVLMYELYCRIHIVDPVQGAIAHVCTRGSAQPPHFLSKMQ